MGHFWKRHMLFWGRPSSHDVPVSIAQPMHVYNAYFRQSEARNILQICNIICVNGIHILNGGTETEMSSFWWNFHHWLHWKLSKWQLPVQLMIKISSKSRHFRFSGDHFHHGIRLRTQYAVLRMPPFPRCTYMNYSQLLITKFMFDMFKMHLWDNQKIEDCYRYVM